jgi:hypothetical protein
MKLGHGKERRVVVRGFWTITGVGLVLAVTALSMRMNFEFGYSLGTSEGTGRIFGFLSVAFDGLKALLPLFVAWQWRDGRKLRAAAGALLFVLVATYGFASALGFASQHREGVTASQENLNASLKEHAADLDTAETRLKALGAHRVSGAVEADIARLKKDRLWDGTSGCTDATLNTSREFCKRIESLRAELALAAEDNVLTAKIEGLKFRISQLRAKGAGREADPQLGEIARAAGLDILRVRSGMNWLLAIAVEAVSCFGLFAIAWQRQQRAPKREAEGARPWRLVEGVEVLPPRPLLRLTARAAAVPAPGKAKGSKAKGNSGRKARAPPRGSPRDETDQSMTTERNVEKGAIDVR